MTCTPGLLGSERTSSTALGVVVTMDRGCRPRRRANARLSHDSLGYCHDASSSHHAASNCGPRNWSGSWLENTRAKAPLGQVSFRLEGSYVGLSQGGDMLMMPDSPSIMTDCASSRARATRAMRVARLFSTWVRTHSAPVRVFPNPRPARMSQVSQSPSGGSWESRAWSDQSYVSLAISHSGRPSW